MPDADEIAHLLRLLASYRESLSHQLEQRSNFDVGLVPTHLSLSIAKSRREITKLKAELRRLGEVVEDWLTDHEASPSANQQSKHQTTSNHALSAHDNANVGIGIAGSVIGDIHYHQAPQLEKHQSNKGVHYHLPLKTSYLLFLVVLLAGIIFILQNTLKTFNQVSITPTPSTNLPQIDRETNANSLLAESKKWPITINHTFDTDTHGWPTDISIDEYAEVYPSIDNGYYKLSATTQHNGGIFAFHDESPIQELTDFLLYVDITKESGIPDSNAGILFRRDDQGSFYRFRINPHEQTFAAIKHLSPSIYNTLIQPTRSSYIHSDIPNRLTILAQENYFAFFINDHFVGDFTDNSLVKGGIIVSVGFSQQGSAKYSFDNLEIHQPLTP